MTKIEKKKLFERYQQSAESYGISQSLSKIIAKKIVFGNSGGHFIESVFRNKLIGAVINAGTKEMAYLPNIAKFIYHEVPSRCIEQGWKGF